MIIRKLTIGYLQDFLKDARKEDLKDVELASGIPFTDKTLEELVDANTKVLIDRNTGKVYGIGGVTEEHLVWLLCTYEVERNKIKFLRFMRKYLKDVLKGHPFLFNVAWLGNTLHIKWLTWLGAKWIKGEQDVENFRGFFFGNVPKEVKRHLDV